MAFKDILGGMIGTVIEQGAAIADEFHLSGEEKAEFKQRDEERLLKLREAIETTVQARYSAVSKIIASEMQHGSNFTKNARPSLVYSGLAMFFIKMIGSGFGVEFDIPSEFTYTWGGVCGVWVLGRSTERVAENGGLLGKAAAMATGNKALPEL